jgi:PAS domain S-box-containing protein
LHNRPTSLQFLRIQQLEDEYAFGLVGTYYLDYHTKIVFADPTLSTMYGLDYSPDGMPLADFLSNISPEDLQRANHLREHQIYQNKPYEIEYRIQHPGGKETWVLARAQVRKIGDNIFYEGIVIDITSGKEADRALQAQNKLNKTITDNATSALLLMNDKGFCTFVNPAGEAMFGYSNEEIKTKPLHYLIHHHHPDGRLYPLEDCPLDRALPQNFEMRAHEDLFFRKDGTSLPVLCAVSPIFENGVPVATVIEVRDNTEQKKAEMLLQRHTERLQLLNSFSASVSESLNMQEILEKVSDAATQLTSADCCIFSDNFIAEGIVRLADVRQEPKLNAHAVEIGLTKADLPIVSYLAVPVLSKSGRIIGCLFLGHKEANKFNQEHESLVLSIASQAASAMDNAELFQEIKVLNTKKDEFLSIASHELKTPLTSIKAFNQLMRRTRDMEKMTGYIEKSAGHIVKLEKLVNDLLDVTKINAGKMQYNMQPFSFQQMLRESIESVQHTVSTHEIILNTSLDVEFNGDQLRLEQVLNNFLINAVKYSPDGKKVLVNAVLEEGNIIVSVQDFGVGIPHDHLSHLFERYYRVDNTAMRFEGLGLGLFISSEILKRHNGGFWIESEPGKGSTFYFRLPTEEAYRENVVLDADTYYQDSTITIRYRQVLQYLDVDWKGFHDMKSVKAGCMKMLEMLAKNNCKKVINDNTNVLGTWSEAAEWVGQEWFPMMEKAGLTHFAWIFSSGTFSRLSAMKSIDVKEGSVITRLFANINEARAWLKM